MFLTSKTAIFVPSLRSEIAELFLDPAEEDGQQAVEQQIVQAGRNKIAIMSVPIRTNAELRPSRLFSSMFGYVKKSMLTIIRSYIMYKPLQFFIMLGSVPVIAGLVLGIRFLVRFFMGNGDGNVQSLILVSLLITIGVLMWVIGILADTIAANRKIMQDVQMRVRRMDYEVEKISKMVNEDK